MNNAVGRTEGDRDREPGVGDGQHREPGDEDREDSAITAARRRATVRLSVIGRETLRRAMRHRRGMGGWYMGRRGFRMSS